MVRETRLTVCASHSPGTVRDARHEQGLVFRAGVARASAAIADFDPDVVIVFGTDHRRAFVPTVPTIAVVTAAEGWGDYDLSVDPFRIDKELALEIAAGLLAADIDVAVTRSARLDHGFGQAVQDLLGGPGHLPIVPVFINSATPPLCSPHRAIEFGRAIGRLTQARAGRIAFVGSGGLSHAPPSLQQPGALLSEVERRALNDGGLVEAATNVSPPWDHAFLERLGATDASWSVGLDQAAIDPGGVGANEVRTWLAARAAGGHPLTTIAYEPVPEWITGMGVAGSAWAFGPSEQG